nr:hypothetical protein TTURR_g7 [Trichoderma turrialbense]
MEQVLTRWPDSGSSTSDVWHHVIKFYNPSAVLTAGYARKRTQNRGIIGSKDASAHGAVNLGASAVVSLCASASASSALVTSSDATAAASIMLWMPQSPELVTPLHHRIATHRCLPVIVSMARTTGGGGWRDPQKAADAPPCRMSHWRGETRSATLPGTCVSSPVRSLTHLRRRFCLATMIVLRDRCLCQCMNSPRARFRLPEAASTKLPFSETPAVRGGHAATRCNVSCIPLHAGHCMRHDPRLPRGSEIVPQKLSLRLSKKLRNPSSGQLGLGPTSGVVAFGPAKLGFRMEGLGDQASPKTLPHTSSTTTAFQLTNNLHTYWTWGPVAAPSYLSISIQVRGLRMYGALPHDATNAF